MSSRNVLDKKKSHALTVWLTDNAPSMRENTMQEVADMAASSLGFPVTKANVTSVRDAFDLDLGRHQAAAPDQSQIIEELRAKVAELTHQVSVMATQLRRAMQHLEDHGETDLPPGLNGTHALPAQLSL